MYGIHTYYMLLQIYNYQVSDHSTNHIRNTNKIRKNLINV